MTKKSQPALSLWPVVVATDGVSLYSRGENILIHQDGTCGSMKGFEHAPRPEEIEQIKKGIADTRKLCEDTLKELAAVESALKLKV